ncbi:GerAB/ArcD/ProY family transporter [Paenibacillus lactis]|uniref:GerAB/ArcD/ProY family transporter n=1 Tax=Paenibacillus lactis TaxID=228574 RepID=UPI0036CCED9A
MNGYRQISPGQWFFISLFSTICLTPFGFPTTLYRFLGHGAWVPIVAAYLLTLWSMYVSLRICERFQGLNLVQWSLKVMGRWVGSLYAIGVVVVMYLWGVFMLFVFLDLIIYSQLHYTSRFLILIFLIGAVVYLLSQGLEVWVRWGELFAVLLLIGLLFINVPQLANANFSNLLPFHNPVLELSTYLKPELIAALFIFRGIFSIYFLHPHIKPSKHLYRWSMFSITLAFIAVLAAIVLPITIFGASFAGKLAFPYQESLGTVALPWLPIERITLLTPIVWQIIIVYVLCVSLFSTARGIKSLLNMKKERMIIYVLGVVTLGLTIYPVQQKTVFIFMVYWSLIGGFFLIVIPSFLWAIFAIKRGGAK